MLYFDSLSRKNNTLVPRLHVRAATKENNCQNIAYQAKSNTDTPE